MSFMPFSLLSTSDHRVGDHGGASICANNPTNVHDSISLIPTNDCPVLGVSGPIQRRDKMGWFGNKVAKIKHDPNLTRAVRGVKYASKELRAGTGNWMLKKVPIVQWLPAYMPKWLAGDAIAGISVGLLLVPQAVTYSALAGVPIQTALLSSWLPGMIYAITGTSKGMLYTQYQY